MNDCVSQVKILDSVLEEKKAQKRFLHIVSIVLNEHYPKLRLQILEWNEVSIEHVWHFSLPPSENFCPSLKF